MSDKRYREIKILIASPGDVTPERDCAERVIRRLEIYDDNTVRLLLTPKRWEFDAASEMGKPPQEIINRQLVDECDCVVCIFWTRIGTPTDVAPGGAVEELERMVTAGKLVMLYFSRADPAFDAIDPEQFARLHLWKKTLVDEKRGLVKVYQNIHEFEGMLERELRQQLPAWFGGGNEGVCKVDHIPTAFALLQRYHATLKRQFGDMTLMGSPAFGHLPLKFSETYVSLSLSGSLHCEDRTTAEGCHCDEVAYEKSSKPEKVMRGVFFEQNYPLLLIIGDPGSGKTTLLKHYALCCLDEKLSGEFGFSEPVHLFFLPLRELQKSERGYAELEDNLAVWSEKNVCSIDVAHFSLWLEQPSTLVLLDGLDEISHVDDRIAVCQWIDHTVGRLTKAKFVVTSRSTGYRKGDGIELESGHRRADILDFSSEQKTEFLHRWFKAAFLAEIRPDKTEMAEWQKQQVEEASKKEKAILAFLAEEKNKSLRLLAGVPLLLQIMAMLWKERGYLAKDRIELYDAALNFMLDYRDRRRGMEPLLAAKDARRVLSPVSLWMQEELQKDEVDRADMQQQMQVQLDTLNKSLLAEEFCRNLLDRAGLLLEYGDRYYVFRHKSFREYMAGVQLVKNMHRPEALKNLVSHFGDDWWTEVFRFFIAHVEDADLFNRFMKLLFDSPVTDILEQKQLDLLIALIEEAPQCKIDALKNKLLARGTSLERQRYLIECLKAFHKPDADEVLQEFRKSGLSKEKVGVADVQHDKLAAEYILIKGGTFIYSQTKKPETVQDLYVAKYTVTNKHYRQFINYLDAQEPEFAQIVSVQKYTEGLQKLASGIKGFSEWLNKETSLVTRFRSNYDDDKRFNKDDQPVVGVSWYAACAYCLWLSLLEGDRARYELPNEVQWEWAAGGQRDKPDKVVTVRDYPWQEEKGGPNKMLANYNEHEGGTTSVGRYPAGATPEGLYDMAGNVWEWMENWYDNDEDWLAWRGGSWYNKADALRCSSRSVVDPWFDGISMGFRVIRSSPFSSCISDTLLSGNLKKQAYSTGKN